MGSGERAPEIVTRYRLGPEAARRRAMGAALVGATIALAPALLGLELMPKLGWVPTGTFWTVAAVIGLLMALRMVSQYQTVKRRLTALSFTMADDGIAAHMPNETIRISRERVASIFEVDGELGGLRVESIPEEGHNVVMFVSVPRGGDGFGDLRARLAEWRPIDRRRRIGTKVRLLFGAGVVAAVFFLPFLLDDFVGRSKALAVLLVTLIWIITRYTLRGR